MDQRNSNNFLYLVPRTRRERCGSAGPQHKTTLTNHIGEKFIQLDNFQEQQLKQGGHVTITCHENGQQTSKILDFNIRRTR